MEEAMKDKLKYILTLISHLLPLILTCLFLYKGGFISTFVTAAMWQAILIAGFNVTKSRKSFAFLCTITALFAFLTDKLSTLLYYNRISSDSETILVGNLLTVYAVLSVLVLSASMLVIKGSEKYMTSDENIATADRKLSRMKLNAWGIPIGAIVLGFAMFIVGSMLWQTFFIFKLMSYIGVPLIFAGGTSIIPLFIIVPETYKST